MFNVSILKRGSPKVQLQVHSKQTRNQPPGLMNSSDLASQQCKP